LQSTSKEQGATLKGSLGGMGSLSEVIITDHTHYHHGWHSLGLFMYPSMQNMAKPVAWIRIGILALLPLQ